jgi:predicted nucleic acid-binding Zn finger protein
MNTPLTDYKAKPKHLELLPNEAVTVLAQRGTEVRVEHGLVWITQEGDGEDYIVAAGTRFCSGYSGNVVVSTLSEASRIVVSWSDPKRTGGYTRSGVWLDYGRIEQLERAAQRARAQELSRLVRDSVAWLALAWRRTMQRRKPATRLAPR